MAKILIAEDERDIRDLITFTLRFAGHEVVATSNGEEAYFKAQEVMPDLIMMDVRMPRMTGYEACRKMKQHEELKPIPVVFLSAKGQESEVQAGLEAGAVEYILKPFAPDQLTTRVNALLAKYGSSGQSGQSDQSDQTVQSDQSDQSDQTVQSDQTGHSDQTIQSSQGGQTDQSDQTDQTSQSNQPSEGPFGSKFD